jgi:hypothetical protein
MFSLDKNVNLKKLKKVIVNIFQVKSKDVSCKEAKIVGQIVILQIIIQSIDHKRRLLVEHRHKRIVAFNSFGQTLTAAILK